MAMIRARAALLLPLFLRAGAAHAALPTITVTAKDAHASEVGRDTATFLLKRTGPAENAIVVGVKLSGTAQLGADYTAPPHLVMFRQNVSSVEFVVTPEVDDLREGPETVTLEIEPTDYYTVGGPKQATITIADAAGGGSASITSRPAKPDDASKPANPSKPSQPTRPVNPGSQGIPPGFGKSPAQNSGVPVARRASNAEFEKIPVGARR
jgi:hypothetical protein